MARNRDSTKTDFSSFMCIILMLTGALVTIMIANITIISANPDNIVISAVMGLTEFADGNEAKNANYIDVYRDRLDLFFDKGNRRESIPLSDLEIRGNQFEQFMEMVKAEQETEYIVLLVRPHASHVSRRLIRTIMDSGIDLGFELFESDKEVRFEGGMVAEQQEEY